MRQHFVTSMNSAFSGAKAYHAERRECNFNKHVQSSSHVCTSRHTRVPFAFFLSLFLFLSLPFFFPPRPPLFLSVFFLSDDEEQRSRETSSLHRSLIRSPIFKREPLLARRVDDVLSLFDRATKKRRPSATRERT